MPTPTKPITPRIPAEVDGIQVNFCKNPLCPNYGTPASILPQPRGRRKNPAEKDAYIIIGSGRGVPILQCKLCGECPTIKSNLAISEELVRMVAYLKPPHIQLTCPDPKCDNSRFSVLSAPKRFIPYKETTAGNPRFRCRICGKTFTVRYNQPPLRRKAPKSHLNKSIFLDLVEKSPFRGIASKHGISMRTVYDKIEFIHRQCLLFAANRERGFPDRDFGKISIAVDRQEYRLNWPDKGDRRNVVIQNLSCAETKSGYILASHLNYDRHLVREEIEKNAQEVGDHNLKSPFRKYARLWVTQEQPEPKGEAETIEPSEDEPPIYTQIKQEYADTEVRADVEVPTEDFQHKKLPAKGVLVHAEYTLYAHFQFLKKMLAGTERIVFYLDRESGIRAACLSAFWVDVLSKRVDAFYVKVDKTLTNDQKKRLCASVKRQEDEFRDENRSWLEKLSEDDEPSIHSIRQLCIERELEHRVQLGPWQDYWLQYPFPDMSEPRKAVCWLTDIGGKTIPSFKLARLFLYASLHSVDRFFMQLRRKTSLLERPIKTSSSAGRTWYAYDPYNPAVVEMEMEIYRVYYNYVKIGNDGKTPAMRFGVAKRPVAIEDILYYQPSPQQLLSRKAIRLGN